MRGLLLFALEDLVAFAFLFYSLFYFFLFLLSWKYKLYVTNHCERVSENYGGRASSLLPTWVLWYLVAWSCTCLR